MSYYPTLIIKISDLDKYKEKFETASYGIVTKADEKTRGGEENKTVMEYISWVYFNGEIIDIFGTKCKYCTPTFSSYNKLVRETLDKMKIRYSYFGG